MECYTRPTLPLAECRPSDCCTQLPFGILQIPSYVLQLKRSLFPKAISSIPQLLHDGTLVDATAHASHIAKGSITYAEDAVIWPQDKIAVFSTDPGRGVFNAFTGEGDEARAGNGSLKIWVIGSSADVGVTDLQLQNWPEGRTFHPLGINVLEITGSGGREAFLAIANCMSRICSIELVRLVYTDEGENGPSLSATYLHSLEHPSITAPNAVVILSESQILFTNSFGFPPRKSLFLNTLEQFLAIPGGSVQLLTYDSAQKRTVCDKVISGISLANGLAMNKDMSILAVAGSTAHYVKIYDISNVENGITSADQVKLRRTIHVGMTPDNLRFLESPLASGNIERLLCAGHPRVLEFVKVAKNPSKAFRSPSKVVKIKVEKPSAPSTIMSKVKDLFSNQDKDAVTVFESLGSFYGTSSTAVAYRSPGGMDEMVVCGLFQDGVLVCKSVDLEF